MGSLPERIVLIGLRRSGKNAVGRIVAAKTGRLLLDTDEIVQRMTGRSPADWIRHQGIEAFRDAESAAVATLADARETVVATGGGAPLSARNREILRRSAFIAYLRVDPWLLAERTRTDPDSDLRPPLTGAPAHEENHILFTERDGPYRSFCDLVVDGARPADEVAEKILEALRADRKIVP
jgi:shikimate kinase